MNGNTDYRAANDEERLAIKRFKELHPSGDNHALNWMFSADGEELTQITCTCGATLHLDEPIFVSIEPPKVLADGLEPVDKAAVLKAMRTREKTSIEAIYESALVTLDDETLQAIRLNPSITDMHFGLGLYIRNRFIHSGKPGYVRDPDSTSSAVLRMLVEKVLPEFASLPLFYSRIKHGPVYEAFQYCVAVKNRVPVEEVASGYRHLVEASEVSSANPYSILNDEEYEQWRAWEDRSRELEETFDQAFLQAVWSFNTLADALSDSVVEQARSLCLESLNEDNAFIPSEIAYFLDGRSNPPDVALCALSWTVSDIRRVRRLPSKVFTKRETALEAAKTNGDCLQFMPKYRDDIEVVTEAVTNNASALNYASDRLTNDRELVNLAASHAFYCGVFDEEPLSNYDDDDEIMRLAIKANGANIADASDRIRNDIDFALLAVQNRREYYPDEAYESLTPELKRDRRIVEAVARTWEPVPNCFPPKEFADDDTVASLLARHEDHFDLFGMSRRIKEQYYTEDELERWGDDPWWWE